MRLICFIVIYFLLFQNQLELTQNPPEGIVAGPISEENFFEWESFITYYNAKYLCNSSLKF